MIDPVCERCGLCCQTYSFWFTNRDYDNDQKEIKRLIEYHGCTPIRNAKGELGIRIPISCRHLVRDGDKYSCEINETKPVVCREYVCEKIIRRALEESISNGVHV